MNRIIILLSAVIMVACNNNAGNNNAAMPEQEKQLREQVNQYPDSLLLKENLIEYFHSNSNYGQAIAETDKALAKDSLNERLLYIKATLHGENDDTLQAINTLERLIKLNPDPKYFISLGTLYATYKDPLALAMGDLLMSPAGGNAIYQGIFIKGLYLNNTGQKQEAIAFFEKCISLDYTNVYAYREKATAEYDLGKYVDALKTLELALAVQKTYDEAYYLMGRCYEKLGKKEAAVENYQMALQFAENHDYPEAKDALGKLGIVQ